jgi:ribosomal protein S6E (S10)
MTMHVVGFPGVWACIEVRRRRRITRKVPAWEPRKRGRRETKKVQEY